MMGQANSIDIVAPAENASAFALGYSQKLEMPTTRKDGLLNFVQMIINAAERGEVREAILLAVDLKDTLSGNSNPFSSVTDGFTKDAVDKEIEAMRKAFLTEKREAIAKAHREGAAQARSEMLRVLQAA